MAETEQKTIEQIGRTDELHRRINHDLMVHWINAKLTTRANHDVRRSIVIYDEDKVFLTACTRETWKAPGIHEQAHDMGGRYWSKGIV